MSWEHSARDQRPSARPGRRNRGAARWQPVPGAPATGPLPVTAAAGVAAADPLAAVRRIADQSGGIRERLARLAGLPGWPAALAAPQIPASAEALRSWLAGLVDAATIRYLRYGHGERHHARALGHRPQRGPAHASHAGQATVGAQRGRILGRGRGADRYLHTRRPRPRKPNCRTPPAGPQAVGETFAGPSSRAMST
jgi:hypothetical protein